MGINVLSLFDGISCGALALERANIEAKNYWSSEIDKYAQIVSDKNYPDIIRLGDITKWREWDIKEPVDLILAGFPCQPYSVAGKRLGLKDSRGGNIVDCMISVIEKYQPTNFMLENVPGLLSIDNGETFKNIAGKLNEIGFAIDWIIINSSLVSAQNRERLYIIGKRLYACNGSEYAIDVGIKNKRSRQYSLF